MRFIATSSWCYHSSSAIVEIPAKEPRNNLFVTCPHVLDVFFVHDTTECDMPDRNVEALAMGSTSLSVTGI
jgi:hypothetical protein